MSTPLVTNIVPQHGESANVGVGSRFSLRDSDTEIDRSKIDVYLGTGKVFYDEAVLPEDRIEGPSMFFEALSGHPNDQATRNIVDGYLRIDKNLASNMQAVYRMGGLESPAASDDPVMFEFTLRADFNDVTYEGVYSGIQIGLYINDSGLTLKFIDDGARKIALCDAGLTGPSQGTAVFDWDVSVGLNSDGSNTYKLFWNPALDEAKLYVKDASANTDRLIATVAISAFGVVPDAELRENQPWLIFGHGAYPTAISISDWKGVFLHDAVTQPMIGGIQAGGHRTLVLTNGHTEYDGRTLPELADKGWVPFTESYGPIGGVKRVVDEGLELVRDDPTKSLGFYRIEPKVTGPYVVDFYAYGLPRTPIAGSETTGMELFLSDGVKDVRLAFLQDSLGTQYIGLLGDLLFPDSILSYSYAQQGYSAPRRYRLVLLPGIEARLINMIDRSGEGLVQESLITLPYTALPDIGSDLPSPAIGFLHNALSGEARSTFMVLGLRYSNIGLITDWRDFVSPSPTWSVLSGGNGTVEPGTNSVDENIGAEASITEAGGVVTVTGLTFMSAASEGNYLRVLNGDNPGIYRITTYISTTSVIIENPSAVGADSGNPDLRWEEIIDPEFMVLTDDPDGSNAVNTKLATGEIQEDNGWFVEWRVKVASYTVLDSSTRWNSGTNGSRTHSGVSLHVSDGTYVYWVHFADAGPAIGKVVFIQHGDYPSTPDGVADNLLAIRAFDPKVSGTYAVIDWSSFHLYRLEKTVGGKVALLADESVILQFDEYAFSPPTISGAMPSRIQIGHFDDEIVSVSHWGQVHYGFSDGFDIFTTRLEDEDDLQSQFNQGINLLVEAEDI